MIKVACVQGWVGHSSEVRYIVSASIVVGIKRIEGGDAGRYRFPCIKSSLHAGKGPIALHWLSAVSWQPTNLSTVASKKSLHT